MRKRACSIFGVAAFLIAGTQLSASELPPFDSSFGDAGSAVFEDYSVESITGILDLTSGSVFDEEGASDDVLVLNDAAAAPATVSSNVGLFTPEPASVAMFLIGAAGVALGVCRRRR